MKLFLERIVEFEKSEMFYLTGQLSPATHATCAVVLDSCVALGYADRVECWPLSGDATPHAIKTSHAIAAMDKTASGDLVILTSSGTVRLLDARDAFKSVFSVSVFEAAGAFRLETALLSAATETVLVHFFEGCVHLLSLTGKSASRKLLLPEACEVLTFIKPWGSGWLAISGDSFFILKQVDGELVISSKTSTGSLLSSEIVILSDNVAVACGSNHVAVYSSESMKVHATSPLGDRPAICQTGPSRIAIFSGATGDIYLCSVRGLDIVLTLLGAVSIGTSTFIRQLTDDKLIIGSTSLGDPCRIVTVCSELNDGNFFSAVVDFPNHTAPVTQMAISADERVTVGLSFALGARFVRSGFPATIGCCMNIPGVADLFIYDQNMLILSAENLTFAVSSDGAEVVVDHLVTTEMTILFCRFGEGFIQITTSTISLVQSTCFAISGLSISHAAVRGSQIIIAQGSGEVRVIDIVESQLIGNSSSQLIGNSNFTVQSGAVTAVAFFGQKIAAASWDAMVGECALNFFHEHGTERIAIDSHGVLVTSLLECNDHLLVGLGDGRCLVYSSSLILLSSQQLGTLAVRISLDADAALVACDALFIFRSGRFSPVILETCGAIRVATAPGAAAVLASDTVMFNVELKPCEDLAVSTVAFHHCTCIYFAANNDCFILGGNGRIGIVDTVRLQLQFEFSASKVTCVAELTGSTNLIVGAAVDQGGSVSLYIGSAQSGFICSDTFPITEGQVTCVCAVGNDRFATASLNVIRLFRIHDNQLYLLNEVQHNYFIVNLNVLGPRLIVGDLLRSVSLLSLTDLKEVATDHSGVDPLTFMCCGRSEIVCANEKGFITALTVDTLQQISRLRLSERVNAICVAADVSSDFVGRFIISGTSGSLRVLLPFESSDLYTRLMKLSEVITRYAEEAGYLIDTENGDKLVPRMINGDILRLYAKVSDATRSKILSQAASVISGDDARRLLSYVDQVTSASRF